MPTSHPFLRSLVPGSISILGLAASTAGLAQSLPASDNEVVTLPEFTVTESRSEWVSNQAVSGTRTAADVIDLPYNVQVITSEFLNDFQLLGLTEQMSFFTGYSGGSDLADPAIGGSGQAGNMLRGFSATIIRDGFAANGVGMPTPTTGNTASIENISGPISTLYGDVQPGGVINYITKRPSLSPEYSVLAGFGSYNLRRSNVCASGPLVGDKLYYLASIDYTSREGRAQYTYADTWDYLGSLLWQPTKSTSLRITYEAVRLDGARAASIPHLMVGTKVSATNPLSWSGGVDAGIDWDLAEIGYSRFGPEESYYRDYDGVNVLLEHAYNEVWKQRVSYMSSWKHFSLNYRTNSNVSAETGRMNNVQPNQRVQSIIAPNNLQTDLLGTFRTGPVKQALLFVGNYNYINTRDYQMRLPTAEVATLPDSYRYQDPFDPDWAQDDWTPFDYSRLTRLGSKSYEKIRQWGAGATDRLFFADDRIILLGGARYDRADFWEDTSTATGLAANYIRGNDDNLSYSGGLNCKVFGDRLVLYTNHSTSFNANPTVDRNTGTTIENERGRGTEVGFKSVSFDKRLGLTVSVYQNEKVNIGQSNPDFVLGEDMPEYLGTGTNRVRGIDGNVFLKTGGFTIRGGVSCLDAKVVASTNASLVGTRMLLVPRLTSSLAVSYRFSGWLDGLRLGAAYRYTGSFVRANATATVLFEESSARGLANAFINYSWERGRYEHTVSLNGANLSDEFYVGPDGGVGLGRQINLTYTLSFR